ncbi:MAG: DUF4071 domain-containing protein [Saprospiraceae bacterium]|nr:DUF4071 domain-containing protein [Saprospiraceae bacterium]
MNSLCFVLMPFNIKKDKNGREINFDVIYKDFIKPSIEAANLEPIRADAEVTSGSIHSDMYERLILCNYAIADLTTANANVYYELGIRYALKPHTTIPISAFDDALPFDVQNQRVFPYKLNSRGNLVNKKKLVEGLTSKIKEMIRLKEQDVKDSPVFQSLPSYHVDVLLPEIEANTFREDALAENEIAEQLELARERIKRNDGGSELVGNIEKNIKKRYLLKNALASQFVVSYRTAGAWNEMVRFIETLDAPVRSQLFFQEQLGFALNRIGRRTEAEVALKKAIKEHGANGETNGILGRVYKDLWQEAEKKAPGSQQAKSYLNKAIGTYLNGFESDWRNYYPGVNLLTLMYQRNPNDPKIDHLYPVVKYATEQAIKTDSQNYWVYATMLELLVLKNEKDQVIDWLIKMKDQFPEDWQPTSTLNNLSMYSSKEPTKYDWLDEVFNNLK